MLNLTPKAQTESPHISPKKKSTAKASYDKYLLTGFAMIIALITGCFLWAAMAPIQGGVIAPGTVVGEGKPNTLQHVHGSIVG